MLTTRWSTPARRGPRVVAAGATLRIVDLDGNQAVDCLLYNADDPAERYSAPDTIAAQGNIFLVAGIALLSNEGRPMMTVTATTLRVPRHHRRRLQPRVEHAALRPPHRATSTPASTTSSLAGSRRGLGKRDLCRNINWFMNVPVEADGTLGIVDGISAPGLVGRPAGRDGRARR